MFIAVSNIEKFALFLYICNKVIRYIPFISENYLREVLISNLFFATCRIIWFFYIMRIIQEFRYIEKPYWSKKPLKSNVIQKYQQTLTVWHNDKKTLSSKRKCHNSTGRLSFCVICYSRYRKTITKYCWSTF